MGLQQTVDKWVAQSRGISRGGGTGGALTDSPYIDMNFLTETYLLDGEPVALGTLLEENAGWGGFTADIDADGLLVSNPGNENPGMPVLVEDVLDSADFTIVLNFRSLADGITNFNVLSIDYLTDDLGRADSDWYFYSTTPDGLDVNGVVSDNIALDEVVVSTVSNVADIKLAVRFAGRGLSACLNGGNVGSIDGADFEQERNVVAFAGLSRIQRLRVYRGYKNNIDLKQLTG
jgi:hypothetical protein